MGLIRPDEQVRGKRHYSYKRDEQKREQEQGHDELGEHTSALPPACRFTGCTEAGWRKHGQGNPAQRFPDPIVIDAFHHHDLLRMSLQKRSTAETLLTSCFASTTSRSSSPLSG